MQALAIINRMSAFINILHRYHEAATLSLAETIWPTRCAVCDLPGASLCEECAQKLSYVDLWRACVRCGSPYGLVQCCECNGATLEALGRDEPGYDACVSAVDFDDRSAKIVRSWKDQGQRSLAYDMASIMASYAHPEWLAHQPTIVPIPASARARRQRGFDHGIDLANELGLLLGLPVVNALNPPKSKDQRTLGRHDRLANMNDRFTVTKGCKVPHAVLLTDDVHTTGATLYAAAGALHAAGASYVWGLTFARA